MSASSPLSAPERTNDRARDALGVPTTLVALVVAVLLVIAGIVAVAISESAAVRAGAVALLGAAGMALAAYLLAVLNRTGVTVDRTRLPPRPGSLVPAWATIGCAGIGDRPA